MSPVAAPTIGCYIGFDLTANAGSWVLGTGALGSTAVLGPAYTTAYTDVGADVRALNIQRGKSRELDQYQAGRCTVVLDNRARDYDPLNLSGPYVTGGVTDVKPGRLIYITTTDPTSGLTYRLFTGRIRNWRLDYTGVFDSTAVVECVDVMAEVAQAGLSAFATTAATTGANAVSILTEVGVTNFTYDAGIFSTQNMTWNGKALAALRTLEISEQGQLYVDIDGDVRFMSQTSLVTDPRSRISQATFGSGNITYETIDIDYDADLILNDVTLTRSGGVAQQDTDADSIVSYGQRAYTATGLANASDVDVLAVAGQIVSKYGEPAVRIRSISFHPRKHAEMMTQALIRRLRDRVTVTFTPVGGGSAISQELFITNIRHNIRAGDMETTFGFESTEWSHGWLLGTDALGDATLGL